MDIGRYIARPGAGCACKLFFPELYTCIGACRCCAGNLSALLTELSAYYTRQKRLRDWIVSALTNPALLCGIGLPVLVFLMMFVVPKVTAVLLEQKQTLPWPTEVLLYIWAILSAGLFCGRLYSAVHRTKKGK